MDSASRVSYFCKQLDYLYYGLWTSVFYKFIRDVIDSWKFSIFHFIYCFLSSVIILSSVLLLLLLYSSVQWYTLLKSPDLHFYSFYLYFFIHILLSVPFLWNMQNTLHLQRRVISKNKICDHDISSHVYYLLLPPRGQF